MKARSSYVPKFASGLICITPGALEALTPDDVVQSIQRHQFGDWGDMDEAGCQENERSLKEGHPLFSIYHSSSGRKFYIITEADQSVTTLLLPEEY